MAGEVICLWGIPVGAGTLRDPQALRQQCCELQNPALRRLGRKWALELSTMSELQQLQQCDIPAARQVLRDNHCNLHQVADYCESNYVQVRALRDNMG